MKGIEIYPPNYREIKGSIVFLAGPITGAPEWQDMATKYFRKHAEWLNIDNPRRNIDIKYKEIEENGTTSKVISIDDYFTTDFHI